jgi:hypothetical protein
MTSYHDLLLGAYAMAPDSAAEDVFYDGIAEVGIGGLEMPLPLSGARTLDPAWIARHVRSEWDVLMTCIPTVMARLGSDVRYGLAATDDDARSRAVADVGRARDLALRLADLSGRRRVTAIQVPGAPDPERGSRAALARSLAEIAEWDLAGAEILVEHCDAAIPGQAAAKGFLSLDDEIAAVLEVMGTAPGPVGMSVNWGRSAIEGRHAATAVEHVTAVAEAGLLRVVVLSGATDAHTLWGPAWSDAHIPPRGDDPALAASAASLLGPDEIAATLRAAGPGPQVVVKVSVRPADADVATRLAVARAALAEVAAASSSVAARPAG